MTFKDLKKRIVIQSQEQNLQLTRLFERLSGKPFWIWDEHLHRQEDVRTNGDCCFNHIVGLPAKDKVEHPIYDYEKVLYHLLLTITINHSSFKNKHLWVKKATGLGVTEFMLRIMAWLCTTDQMHIETGQICIVTGPNIEMAIKLIKRMKNVFERKLGLIFQKKKQS